MVVVERSKLLIFTEVYRISSSRFSRETLGNEISFHTKVTYWEFDERGCDVTIYIPLLFIVSSTVQSNPRPCKKVRLI